MKNNGMSMIKSESLSLIINELNKITYPEDTLKFHTALEEFKKFIVETNLLQQENIILRKRINLLFESLKSSSQIIWCLKCENSKLRGRIRRLMKI